MAQSSAVNKLCIEYAKAFYKNVQARSTVCDRTQFGFYMDLKYDFGTQRVSKRLKKQISEMFEQLKCKNISFDQFGGLSLDVDIKDGISFAN